MKLVRKENKYGNLQLQTLVTSAFRDPYMFNVVNIPKDLMEEVLEIILEEMVK